MALIGEVDPCGTLASGEEDAEERALPNLSSISQRYQMAWLPEPFCPHLAEVLCLRRGHSRRVGVSETFRRHCKVYCRVFRRPAVPWQLKDLIRTQNRPFLAGYMV